MEMVSSQDVIDDDFCLNYRTFFRVKRGKKGSKKAKMHHQNPSLQILLLLLVSPAEIPGSRTHTHIHSLISTDTDHTLFLAFLINKVNELRASDDYFFPEKKFQPNNRRSTQKKSLSQPLERLRKRGEKSGAQVSLKTFEISFFLSLATSLQREKQIHTWFWVRTMRMMMMRIAEIRIGEDNGREKREGKKSLTHSHNWTTKKEWEKKAPKKARLTGKQAHFDRNTV